MIVQTLGKGTAPDVCALTGDRLGVVYAEQTGPRTEGRCVFQVHDAALRRLGNPVILPGSTTVNCYPRVRVINGLIYVAYVTTGPETAWLWREDTGTAVRLGPAGGMRPLAFGSESVYRVDQQQPVRTVWEHTLLGTPTPAATRQSSQGLARVEEDGTLVWAEDASLHGLWACQVAQVGDLTVLENGDDGLVVSITPQVGSLQALVGQAAHDPRAVGLSDGSFVFATAGVPHGPRLVRVSVDDIAHQPPPTVAPFAQPLFSGSAGVYWTGGTERAAGTCTLVDAAYPELATALQHYHSILVDGYDASIAGAAPHWDRVRAVVVFCETSQARLQTLVDEAVSSMLAHHLPRRPVLVYRGRNDWQVSATSPDAVWYGVEIYPDPREGRDQVERRIARAVAALPPGAPLVAMCATYDRRGSYTNLGKLATLHRVYAETVASFGARGRGVLFWHFTDEGASRGACSLALDEPGLLSWQDAIVRAAGVAPPIVTIPSEGGPAVPTFENMYDELMALSKTSANWQQAINPAVSEAERLEGCEAFMNECAWCFNDDANVAPGAPNSYGKLWRGAKRYSDDCIAIIASDGVLYENDLVTNGGGTDAKLKWGTPTLSKWAFHNPTDPYGDTPVEPGPEPQPPTGGGDDDVHYAINEDLTSRALDELDALNQKHWHVERAPNPSISRYIFGSYEPNMQAELSKIGHLPGDPAVWEKMHDESVYKFTQLLYSDHHGATVPGEPVPAPDPQ